jgi:hypothetical protein
MYKYLLQLSLACSNQKKYMYVNKGRHERLVFPMPDSASLTYYEEQIEASQRAGDGLEPAALDLAEPIKTIRDDESPSSPYNSEGADSRDFFSAFRECARCFFFSLTPKGLLPI